MAIFLFLLPVAIAALLSYALTPLVHRLALRVSAVDHPDSRKVHREPIALMGGLAVLASLLVVILSIELLFPVAASRFPLQMLIGLGLGLLPILAVSIRDDIRPLGSLPKFAAQLAGAGIAIAYGIRLGDTVHLFGSEVGIGLLAIPISLLWIVGVTNAFNLIDGLDGLAAGLAFISAASLAAVSLVVGRMEMAFVSAILAGAILGFLPYNSHPARIFLGDTGASSIGFILACLALFGGSTTSAGLAILVPIVALGVPIADTLVSLLRRTLRKINGGDGGVFEADRGHFHHRLLDLGLSHQHAVWTLYAVGLVAALVALGSVMITAGKAAILLTALAIAAVIGVGRLGYEELAVVRNGLVLKVYDTRLLRSSIFVVFADLALVALAIYGAIVLKYDDWGLAHNVELAREMLVIMPAIALAAFWLLRLYRRPWHLTGIHDLSRLAAAVVVSAVTGFSVFFFVLQQTTSLTFFLTYLLVHATLVVGVRASYQFLVSWSERSAMSGDAFLIYGAGAGGRMALREMLSNSAIQMRPVGFIDDDPRKAGRLIHGFQVFGSVDEALEAVDEGISGVVLSSRKIPYERVLAMRATCSEMDLTFRYFQVDFREMRDLEFTAVPAAGRREEPAPLLKVKAGEETPHVTPALRGKTELVQ
jgi:UDP-GlcNAc:undecaprenyl-phosphate/decaprenyl-phosphate GlcNAc-1-phosphate transferase